MIFNKKSLLTMCALVALSYQPAQAMEKIEEETCKGSIIKKLPKEETQENYFSKVPVDIRKRILKEVFYGRDEKEGFGKTYWNLSLVSKQLYNIIKEHGSQWILEACGIKNITTEVKDVFSRLFKGKLIYTDTNTEVKTVLPISSLPNPLEGEFDLSNCGDAAKYLSINVGYRKGNTPKNITKLEVWFTPWFLVDKKMAPQGPSYELRRCLEKWDATRAPIGIFWTWGGWDKTDVNGVDFLSIADYLITESLDELASENLLKKYEKRVQNTFETTYARHSQNFTFVYELK